MRAVGLSNDDELDAAALKPPRDEHGFTVARVEAIGDPTFTWLKVETTVAAPIEQVWRAYTTPADIMNWNAASDDWHTTKATVDLREGGAFSSRMEAKDGSMGFDFAGTYTKIVEHKRIEYAFGDRKAEIEFTPGPKGVTVRVTFDSDSEPTHSIEQQQRSEERRVGKECRSRWSPYH